MKSVLAAEPAILLKLKSVRIILLVLLCVVVSLLTLSADQSNLDSYIISHFFGTSHFKLFELSKTQKLRVPPSYGSRRFLPFGLALRKRNKKAYSQR